MTTVRTATTRPDICERAPAEPFTAVFERLPLTTMPEAKPAAQVGGSEAEQFAVGVDLVVLPRRVRLRRAEPFGEADEHDPGGRASGPQVVVEPDAVGVPSDGSPLAMSPTIATPLSARSKSFTAATPKTTATSEPGTTGAMRRSPMTMPSEATPTASVRPGCRRGG